MQKPGTFPIAGPTDDPHVDMVARNARNLVLLRDRIANVTRTARPAAKRRPAKGDGQWPSRLPITAL